MPSQRYLDTLKKNEIGVTLETENWDIYFPLTDDSKKSELASLKNIEGKKIGIITGSNCLIDRRIVWLNLVSSYGRKEASFIMPETFVLDRIKDLKLLKSDSRNHFILKDNRHRRLGLKLVESIKTVLDEKENFDIVQPLLTNLQRYKGTSFNLRVYLLLTLHENKLTAYVYHKGVCIYGKPPGKGITMFDRMVTHTRNSIPQEFPVLMNELLQELEIEYHTFFSALNLKINKLLDSAVHLFGKLENLEKANCFQVFGVDVLLTTDNKPIICEINKGPSMKSKNENHSDLKNDMLEEMLSVIGLRGIDNKGFKETSTWKIIT